MRKKRVGVCNSPGDSFDWADSPKIKLWVLSTKKQDEYRKVHLVQVYDHMISVGEIKFGDNYGENRTLEFYCENANNEELSNLFAKLVRN